MMMMLKPHTLLQTLANGPEKFQIDRYKTAGDAHKLPTVVHFNIFQALKMAKFKSRKKWQKLNWR